jgi:hypothetical protein
MNIKITDDMVNRAIIAAASYHHKYGSFTCEGQMKAALEAALNGPDTSLKREIDRRLNSPQIYIVLGQSVWIGPSSQCFVDRRKNKGADT